jgi:hypothetical protein
MTIENKLTLEEVCYSDLRDKLIDLGEEDFIRYVEEQFEVYERSCNESK